MAHQRIHDTTKEKPALRLERERPYLQSLPPELKPAPVVSEQREKLSSIALEQTSPLHHNLNVYDQLVEVTV